MATDGVPSLGHREADPATQLEVDEAVRDYLIHNATIEVLAEFRASAASGIMRKRHEQTDSHVRMVNAFQTMFSNIHPVYQSSDEVCLRVRLLEFSILFTKRQHMSELSPTWKSLELSMRHRNTAATNFPHGRGLPDIKPYLDVEQHNMDSTARMTHEGGKTKNLPIISLLETLPIFMALSAIGNMLQQSKITEVWMRLAAGFMAQAVIEQYLVYGSQRADLFYEAFAWGFDPHITAKEDSEAWMINAMFFNEDGEFEMWHDIKVEHMRAILPPHGSRLLDHLRSLREKELDLASFEFCIVQFLGGLMRILPTPILKRLEGHRTDDMAGAVASLTEPAIRVD